MVSRIWFAELGVEEFREFRMGWAINVGCAQQKLIVPGNRRGSPVKGRWACPLASFGVQRDSNSLLVSTQDQGGVLPAEAEGIAEHCMDFSPTGQVGHTV